MSGGPAPFDWRSGRPERRRGTKRPTAWSWQFVFPAGRIFFGIVIRMYLWEHEPKHVHAEHQALEGKFDCDGNQLVGNITSRNALGLIRQWAELNQAALEVNWSKIQSGQPLDRIPPLE